MAGVALIAETKLNLSEFLPLARDLVGYSVSKQADSIPIPLPPLAHGLACVASFKDKTAHPAVRASGPFLGLFSVTMLVATFEPEMVEVLETAGGMEFAVVDTTQRQIQAAIITGTLAQWRQAVLRACGSKSKLSREARHVYTLVYNHLCKQGLRDMFDGWKAGEFDDKTLLLEAP